jgi:hypothetical protein
VSWHLYLLPMVTKAFPPLGNSRVPKYITDGPYAAYAISDYGFQGWCLCAADISDATQTALLLNADVTKIPDNLDQQIGAALATVQAVLEGANIPAGWVTIGMTYRTMLWIILADFKFMQRFLGVTQVLNAFLSGAVTLDTTFGSLSALNRQRLLDTAASLKLDTAGFTGASTLRQILKGVADQMAGPVVLGGITI